MITGGAGFIGSHTAERLLEEGYSVRLVDALTPQIHPTGEPPAYLPRDAELVRGDVRDYETMAAALRGVDHLLHLAAETSVGQSMYMGDHHVDVNARGTAVVLRAARDAAPDLRTVVLASSRAVYGEGRHRCDRCGPVEPGPRPVERLAEAVWHHACPVCGRQTVPMPTDETAGRSPASYYGMTKGFQEDVCRLDSRLSGTRVVVLRYFNVYGPRQAVGNPYTGLITTLSVRLLSGKPLVLYEGGVPVRDFVHVRDVAAANVQALRAATGAFEILNIGSGRAVSLIELAAALREAFGAGHEVVLSTRFRVGDILASIADVGRARAVLGYRPRVDLTSGLASMRDWLAGQDVEDRSEAAESELRREGVLRGQDGAGDGDPII